MDIGSDFAHIEYKLAKNCKMLDVARILYDIQTQAKTQNR